MRLPTCGRDPLLRSRSGARSAREERDATGAVEAIRRGTDLARRRWMDGLRNDIRSALRLFVRERGLALGVVLTMGLAIGASTSIFGVVRGVLLRPLPYRE